MHAFLRPLSLDSGVPPNDDVLRLSIPDSLLVVNEEQSIDGVGVAQPTCTNIHEEYEWELEHQHWTKDDSLPSKPPPFFPHLFREPAMHDFTFVSSSMDASIVDHLHYSPDVSPSSNNREDKLHIEDPLDPSFVLSADTEDEFIRFSSTPHSSDHEDAKEFIDFSDRGSRDPFTSIFYHNHDSITVDISKPPVYDDLSDDEVETPKTVEAI